MTVIIFITGGDDSDSSTYRTLLIEKQKECVIWYGLVCVVIR